MNIIESAKTAISSGDVALMAWASRNLECEMEWRGDALLSARRRTKSRFPLAKADAIQFETESRNTFLEEIAAMAAMQDRVEAAMEGRA